MGRSLLLALLTLLILESACGIKGPPRPPAVQPSPSSRVDAGTSGPP